MRHTKRIIFMTFTLAVMVTGNVLFAQESEAPTPSETKSEVPELTNFHEVIYKIWHTAWPEKDVTMLRELLPEVERLGAALVDARLPGILREKEVAWSEQRAKLQFALDAYRKAVADTNSQSLFDAAERLHTQYETLVRVIRPPLKELDAFHSALYPLYHYYAPQKNTKTIKGSVVRMKERMIALEKAQLPVRFKGKEQMYHAAVTKLSEALNTLETSLASPDQVGVDKDVNALHSRYEELAKVME